MRIYACKRIYPFDDSFQQSDISSNGTDGEDTGICRKVPPDILDVRQQDHLGGRESFCTLSWVSWVSLFELTPLGKD